MLVKYKKNEKRFKNMIAKLVFWQKKIVDIIGNEVLFEKFFVDQIVCFHTCIIQLLYWKFIN